jgi:hypothetical protein
LKPNGFSWSLFIIFSKNIQFFSWRVFDLIFYLVYFCTFTILGIIRIAGDNIFDASIFYYHFLMMTSTLLRITSLYIVAHQDINLYFLTISDGHIHQMLPTLQKINVFSILDWFPFIWINDFMLSFLNVFLLIFLYLLSILLGLIKRYEGRKLDLYFRNQMKSKIHNDI